MDDAGAIFGEADADRIIEAVRWVEMMRGPRQRQLVASQRAPVSAEPVLVRCTSATPDGDGLYPGIVTWHDGSAWVDAEVACKLRMADGSTPTSGNRYPARPTAHPTAAAYVTAGPAGSGGSAGLALAEADGSPSYTGVTVITVDQADGLSLSQPGGAGTARLDILPATTGQAGVVSTAAQSFNGDKFFNGYIRANQWIYASSTFGFAIGNRVAGGGNLDVCSAAFVGTTTGVSGSDTLGQAILSAVNVTTATGAFSGYAAQIVLDANGLKLTTAPYRVVVGGTTFDGVTTTIGYDKSGGGTGVITVKGGIITGVT